MTSSPSPDLSSLSLSSRPSQQRLHDTYDYEDSANGNSRPSYQYATSPPIPAQSQQYNPLGVTQSPLKTKPMRSGLPTQWLDTSSPVQVQDQRSMSPHNNSEFSSSGGSPPMGQLNAQMAAMSPATGGPDDDIIPTAIVIKNIPFNVRRETLLDIIASLSIPTPYAFNYHLDQQGSFRGLAFANFRQASDADAVVAALNGFDVQGRKLRVEYKKVLQAGEKERIEREKAIRRMRSMQLEKEGGTPYDDFGPVIAPMAPQRSFSSASYQSQASVGSMGSMGSPFSPPSLPTVPPMPVAQPYNHAAQSPVVAPPTPTPSASEKANELDLNDPSTLEIYSRILLFKDDRMRDELAFSRNLSPKQRRVVHLIAQKLGVYHYSVGEGEDRYAVVTRIDPNRATQRPNTMSRAPSSYLSPTSPQSANPGLRSKKSMPDMKTLHSQAPRLSTRLSNGNIRDGYATIASPARRSPGGFANLFGGGGGGFAGTGGSLSTGGGSTPPVPSLPPSVAALNALNGGGSFSESPTSNVVRQPRGPGAGGFGSRRERAVASESQAARGSAGGLEARSHEPLEI